MDERTGNLRTVLDRSIPGLALEPIGSSKAINRTPNPQRVADLLRDVDDWWETTGKFIQPKSNGGEK